MSAETPVNVMSDVSLYGAARREVELKLLIEPKDLVRLSEEASLSALLDGPPERQNNRTIYYDTSDLQLYHHGVALRVQSGDTGCLQTVKTMNSATSSDIALVTIRREWDWPLVNDQLNMAVLTEEDVAHFIPTEVLPNLRPAFVVLYQRVRLLVRPDAVTLIEVDLDLGEVRTLLKSDCVSDSEAGDKERRCAFSAIELKLRAGKTAHLFRFALRLHRLFPLRISMESKADIGYGALVGQELRPCLVESLSLSPITSAAEAFRHVVRHCLRQLQCNEAWVLAHLGCHQEGQGNRDFEHDDGESLAQMLSALRRLRLAFRLFSSLVSSSEAPTLVNDARALTERLAPARDWVVAFSLCRDAGAGLEDPLVLLGPAARTARRAAETVAVNALRAPEYATFLLCLGDWVEDDRWLETATPEQRSRLDMPVAGLSDMWLEMLYQRARKAGRGIRGQNRDERITFHRRIRRLRAAIGILRSLYSPSAVRPFAVAIEELQTTLDALADFAKTRALAQRLGRDTPSLMVWLDYRTGRLEQEMVARWKALKDIAPFWKPEKI
ncbi:triphosphatase [Azospirillaceae bacterium]